MRMFFSFSFLPAALSLLLLAGCGGKDGDSASGEKSKFEELAEAAENMKIAAEEMTSQAGADREPQPPVSFRVLLTYLPSQIADLEQQAPRGETSSMGEWTFSTANADYRGQDNQSASVQIADYAYIGMMYAPVRMWLKMKINKESTEGFERTTEVEGFPAYEKFDIRNQTGEVTILVGDRFIVNITTRGMSESAPRQVAAMMNLKKLAKETAQSPT
jgi:hypothetical protein